MGAVVFYTLPTFVKVWERDTFEGLEGDFALPSWPFKLLILLGATLCGVEFLRAMAGGGRALAARGRGGFAILGAVIVALAASLWAIEAGGGLSKPAIGIVSILFVVVFVISGCMWGWHCR